MINLLASAVPPPSFLPPTFLQSVKLQQGLADDDDDDEKAGAEEGWRSEAVEQALVEGEEEGEEDDGEKAGEAMDVAAEGAPVAPQASQGLA